MKRTLLILAVVCSPENSFAADRGFAMAATEPPKSFPHRIWVACDFESQSPDYAWFGKGETNDIPRYPGNRTALRATERPYQNHAAVMTGINPVPGPRMGKENGLFFRYFLKGGPTATVQHFSLTTEDNWHVNLSGLQTNQWSRAFVNFTQDAIRNDGSPKGFGEGEHMDDFKIFAGKPTDAKNYDLLIDDVLFFANDPALPPEPEPFPNRVIYLAAFDTGEKDKYWAGDFAITDTPPAGAFWRVAASVPKAGTGQMITLAIQPPKPVGSRTKLRFRYYLAASAEVTVQIFDATVQDNRHIILRDLRAGEWTTHYLDFTRDANRNDGTTDRSFPPGNLVDDIFFFVKTDQPAPPILFVDEVVLFDAAK